MKYREMSQSERMREAELLTAQYEAYKKQSLQLNMARGIPSPAQLDLSLDLNKMVSEKEDCFSDSGVDCRTYTANLVRGVPEACRFFAQALNIPEEYTMIGGNSSLNTIYDMVSRMMTFGVPGGDGPWFGKGIKFLCPSPGYDRHFAILECFGIELIPVAMQADGPDMDAVEALVRDPDVRGLICVPKFSNPTGVTFSDEVVRRLAAMETAAPDFRILWDNAYAIHHIYEDEPLADVFALCKEYGNEDRVIYFSSTSKVTFPGAGVSVLAMSEANIKWVTPYLQVQTIGPDKLNQLRHIKFFKTPQGMYDHMERHAQIMRQRFDIVNQVFAEMLAPYGVGEWGSPKGGYFFSLDLPDGCAKETYALCSELGLNITPAGATYPYGKDPRDANLRIAPTFPGPDELRTAMEVLCTCARLVYIKKLISV